MATFWLDPFLEATTQGNGTTDTSTKNGTYAAPFSLDEISNTTSSNYTSLNGVSLSNGDEIRIKGIAFGTLFESHGNVYSDVTNPTYVSSYASLKPVTGNSSFDGTTSTSKSSIYAYQNSDITSYLPNWSHPAFFTSYRASTSTALNSSMPNFDWVVVKTQLGYNSPSDTGIEIFRVKDTYANVKTYSDAAYLGNIGSEVTITAGWTSETEQNGYSILDVNFDQNYKYYYVNYDSEITWDAERLVVSLAPREATGFQNNFSVYINNTTNSANTHVTPMFLSAVGRAAIYRSASSTTFEGNSTTFPYISGNDDGSNRATSAYMYFTHDKAATTIFKNVIVPGYFYLNMTHVNHHLKIGNLYCRAYTAEEGFYRPFRESSNVNGKTVTFLQDSVYFVYDYYDASVGNILEPVMSNLDYNGITGSVTYESGLKKPGIAPLDNVPVSDNYGPTRGGLLLHSTVFKETREISSNNDWFNHLSRTGTNPIAYGSLGKVICNSADYRNTAHNAEYTITTAIGSTDAPQYFIWSGEHNDYDGQPISFIGDPYNAGSSYATLLYNDTINSTGVLVGQWSGTTGGTSNHAYIPLELPVPGYTAGSDNLRVTVSAAYDNGGSGSAEKIAIKAHHRDTTQSNNFRVYTSGDTTISSSDPASPTTATLNLTNVPTSGQEDITNVIVGIQLQFANNTNIQKFYISNVAIETY